MSFPHPVLQEIYSTGQVVDADGKQLPVNSQIPEEYAAALHYCVVRERPQVVIEVGMAYGISTMAILSALETAGDGRLISIDPNQSSNWRAVGQLNIERANLAHRHELVEEPDYIALPELLRKKTGLDFAYVDGWHTFDYVLLDFFYLDKMMRTHGVIGFNDSGYRAVHKALRFISTHRRYEEINVGLARDYTSHSRIAPVREAVKRLSGRSNSDRYYRKREQWEPAWNFYRSF